MVESGALDIAILLFLFLHLLTTTFNTDGNFKQASANASLCNFINDKVYEDDDESLNNGAYVYMLDTEWQKNLGLYLGTVSDYIILLSLLSVFFYFLLST